jgi:hypothetical protein
MKTITLTTFILWAISCLGQEETKVTTTTTTETKTEVEKQTDTTEMLFGNTKVLVIRKAGAEEEVEINGPEEGMTAEEIRANRIEDSLDAVEDEADRIKEMKRSDPHWAGLDFGATILTNGNYKSSFTGTDYWENDPAKSFHMNWNLAEKKLNFGTPYVGLTTGLGFNFTQIAFKKNYLIQDQDSIVTAYKDTVHSYAKNKLRATYVTIPLLLEFNTNHNSDDSWYLAAGFVGGVRVSSQTKRVYDDGTKHKEKRKGTYGLEPFKLDAMVRAGHGDWGIFASYSVIPAFGGAKTAKVHPFNFGLTLNF